MNSNIWKQAFAIMSNNDKSNQQTNKHIQESPSSVELNKDMQWYVSKNGIDVEQVMKNVDTKIYSPKDINPIVALYGRKKPKESGMISIADVFGFDYKAQRTDSELFSCMKVFFDSNGTGRQERGIKMLSYSTETIIDGLQSSFKMEPIVLDEIETGKYIVSENGMHRFALLRMHYLCELSKVKGNITAEETLRKKYEISVLIQKVDYDFTYSNYILRSIFGMPELEREKQMIGCLFYPTERIVFTERNGNQSIITRNELITYIKNNFIPILESSPREIQNLVKLTETYPSFSDYIQRNFPETFENIHGQNTKTR